MDTVLRRLLSIVFLLCAASAQAATVTQRVNTTSTSNGATYASGSFTPAAGELLIACAVVTATLETVARPTATDSQSLGWTWIRPPALKATSVDSLYCFVSNTTAAASAMTVTVDVTGDNGTGADINVWGISSMSRTGLSAIRQVAITSNGAAAGTPAATFANAVLTGNPVLGMVGNATNVAGLTPPGGTVCNGGTFTEDADSGYNTPTTGGEFVHCNSGFTASTVTWGGTSGTAFGVLILELDTAAAPPAVDTAATPTFVQHASGSITQGNTVGSYTLQFANPTLSGNCVEVSVQHATSQPFVKVIDDKGNPYIQVFNNQNNNQKILNFTGVQGTSGVKKLTVTLSANTAWVEVMATEFRNTNCVTDVKTGNTGTATTSVTAGSFTPSNNNSLLVQVADLDASFPACSTTTFTQGSSPWKLLSGNPIEGWVSQYQVQATAAVINPTLTSCSNSFNSTALALQPASTGTAPASGIHVDSVTHVSIPATPPNPLIANWPSTGNLLVFSFTGTGVFAPSSVSSTPSYTWTKRCDTFSSSDIYQWSTENVATDTSQTISITTTGTPTGTTGPILLYAVSGAATSPYDSTMGCVQVSGNQTVSGDLTNAPNGVTPSTANGLIIVGESQSNNLATGVASGAPGNFIPSINDTETSPWPVDQDNAAAVYYNPDTTTLAFSWTTSGGAVGNWWAIATAWKVAVAGATPSQLPTLGCCGTASLSMGNPAVAGGTVSYSFPFSIAPDLLSLASYPACDAAADCKAGVRICQAGTSTKCADFFAGDGQMDVYLIRKQGTSATQAFKAGTAQYSAPPAFGVIP